MIRLKALLILLVAAAQVWESDAWWFITARRRTVQPSSGCNAPDYPIGSIRTGCGWPYDEGETCDFTCRDSYRQESGDTSRTCNGGTWSGEPLVCVYAGCESPAYTTGSWREGCWWPYDSGEECTYSCREGFSKVSGDEIITCSDGSWSGEPLVCQRTSGCDPPPFGVGMTWALDCSWPYEDGETCRFECLDGWEQQSGNTSTTCNGGDWSGEPLVCTWGEDNECDWWWAWLFC